MSSQKTEPWGARSGIPYVFFRLVIVLLLVLLALVGANLYLLQRPERVPYLIKRPGEKVFVLKTQSYLLIY